MNTPALLVAMLLALCPLTAGAGAVTAAGPVSAPSGRQLPAAQTAPLGTAWGWPLDPRPAVLRAFTPPARPWLSGHRGVDLRAANDGAPVLAPASGTVTFVGAVVDRPVITIDHGNGLRSSLEPVASGLAPGTAVAKGDVLGHSLPAHCGTLPCIHWGVRRGEEYVNPLGFVTDLRPSILLPPVDPAPG